MELFVCPFIAFVSSVILHITGQPTMTEETVGAVESLWSEVSEKIYEKYTNV